MRWLACVLIAGCGFSSSSHNEGHRDAATGDPDAALDAPPDALQVHCPATYDLKNGGHSYRKTTATSDYNTIVTECHDGAGYVVAIDSVDEDNWIKDQFGSTGYIWIGLHYDTGAGYRWDDHVQLGTYNNFANGLVPTTPTDACVDKSLSPSSNGVWVPYMCMQAHQGMCECDGP